MKDFLCVLGSIGLTAFSWGVYGPLMREGQAGMGGSHWLPFICVGVAYFLIAVIVPVVLLRLRPEKGSWSATGLLWSFGAGVITAVGALGVILAMTSGGAPIYVMPLIFGGAPVVNTFVSMYLSKSYKAGPIFFAGLILVIAGAAAVLLFNPAAKEGKAIPWSELAIVLAFVALTVVTWGAYGPVLHKGQVAMQGSRLRPFLCVGMAYFLVAVLAPLAIRAVQGDHGEITTMGTLWSLAAGAAGAFGSLGVILAFTFGGKPVYVMPLVFGGAPVINTLTSILTAKSQVVIRPEFYAGLIVVVAGAVTVLIFAPKAGPKSSAGGGKKPAAAPAKKPVGSK